MPTATFSTPFFTGTSVSVEVPGKYDVALNGRPYMLDKTRDFTRQSIPLLRNQADTRDSPGEQSLSPEELWRRSTLSWDHGAGQVYLDREDSDVRRFRSSKGVDVWTRWAMSLLPDTTLIRASANASVLAEVVGDRLYVADGASLLFTTSINGSPPFTTVTGTPSVPLSVTSDGFRVFTSHGTGGVYVTDRTSSAAVSMTTGTVTSVKYVKGRLMAAQAASLFNITSFSGTTPLPTALFTHPNSDFTWVGFTEGNTAIYAAGYSGDKSLIYRIGIRPDGTGLDQPIVAGELPDGEIVRSIGSYLGYVLLGTDRGVRFCGVQGTGSLEIGSITPTGQPVRAFEGQDRYVWFGWSNYDATSTGLGRQDLSTFIFPLTPAYASDLMASGQGEVTSIVTFAGKRVFTVAGQGVFVEATNKVPSGTLDTGLITFGIPDPKVALYFDARVARNVGTNSALIAVDGSTFTLIGTRTGAEEARSFLAGQLVGEKFEIRHKLERDSATPTVGPTVTRSLFRAYPKPTRGEVWEVPLLLHEVVTDRTGNEQRLDPQRELALLQALQQTRTLFVLQVGTESTTVLLDDSVFQYAHETLDRQGWNGTIIVRLKSFGT